MQWPARNDPVVNSEKRTLVRFGSNATETDGPVSIAQENVCDDNLSVPGIGASDMQGTPAKSSSCDVGVSAPGVEPGFTRLNDDASDASLGPGPRRYERRDVERLDADLYWTSGKVNAFKESSNASISVDVVSSQILGGLKAKRWS
ncbi:hypothetical protein L914_16495 [Phytophthora nicotianae]|uniref:Uncharacterized protein n=1 Tax=Phytophthora nicotianae TaxID=4792 RepID=W2MN42_PHYNI|nr:hypothetical protein L914_16495 [Phytophthora nicotianae]